MKKKQTPSDYGRIGGRSTSAKKRKASRLNGMLGGRPVKRAIIKARKHAEKIALAVPFAVLYGWLAVAIATAD
jgi:hypothetical protein